MHILAENNREEKLLKAITPDQINKHLNSYISNEQINKSFIIVLLGGSDSIARLTWQSRHPRSNKQTPN